MASCNDDNDFGGAVYRLANQCNLPQHAMHSNAV